MGIVSSRRPTVEEGAELDQLGMLKGTDFVPERTADLQMIWNGMGKVGKMSRPHAAWKEFGFQGTDPITDIRGGGMLAVQCICNCLRLRPTLLPSVAREQNYRAADGNTFYYCPVMTAAISLCGALSAMFDLQDIGGRRRREPFWAVCTEREFFYEIFTHTFELMMRSFTVCSVPYLNFRSVRDWAIAACRAALSQSPTLDGFRNRLMQRGDPKALGKLLLQNTISRDVSERRTVETTAEARRNASGARSLPRAAEAGDTDTVKALLRQQPDIDINAVDTQGWSALLYAARCGFADIVAILLQHGADPNQVDRGGADAGWGALSWAATYGHARCVETILDHFHKQQEIHGFNDAFGRAAKLGRQDVVDLFFQRYPIGDSLRQDLSRECRRWGHCAMANYLQSDDVPECRGFTWRRRRPMFWIYHHQHVHAPFNVRCLPSRPFREIVSYL